MARNKVKLAFIVNNSARKAAFRKRMKGLRKKLGELSTLCGIEACAIVYYSPNDRQPYVWPSPWGVLRVLTKYMRMPVLEQSKKEMDQESFLKVQIKKAKEQLRKQRNENREKQMTLLMLQCLSSGKIENNLSKNDLNDLARVVGQNLKDITRKMEALKAQMTQGQTLEVPGTTPDEVAENKEKAHADQVDAVPKEHSFTDLTNGAGAETVPLGDVNHKNGF